MNASAEVLQGHYFEAVLDGLTLKERPIDTLNNNKVSNVDFLIGTNADEWYMYLDPNVTHADLVQWVNENAPDQADALLATVQHESDVRRAMDRLISAKEMLCLARQLASKVTRMGGRGWVYHFTRQRSGEGGEALGSYHGAEIPYVFGTHDAWLPTEDRDRELTDTMMDYWVQFARTGDPNIKGRPGWPVYTSQRPYVMELGDEVQVMEAHDTEICALFGEI